VSFRFYGTVADCTADTAFTGGTAKGTIALDGANPGVAHPSTDTGALGPGTYAFKAKWPGDTNYTGNTSGCETFTVNQGSSTVTTTLHKADHTILAEAGSVPLGSVIHDLATVTVTPTFAAPTGSVSFRFYGTVADCTADTAFTGGTAKGTIALDGANPGVAHPSLDTGALSPGIYAFKAKWPGDTNYTGNTSACETFSVQTITIIKNTHGTPTTFTFNVTGPTNLTPTILPVGDPGTGQSGPTPVLPGAYTVDEQGPPAGWTMTDIICTAGSAGPDTNGDGIPNSWNFTLLAGTNVTCTFTDSAQLTTRTQGFWATHTGLANAVWNGTAGAPAGSTPVIGSGDEILCGRVITAIPLPGENILMGGFWSNVAKTSTGDKRSAIDQARMQMLQQYLAAVLNFHTFGSGSEAMLLAARTAYCGDDLSAIKAQIGILGAFNESGDSGVFTPGASATPKDSKLQANIVFWDITK
jgi:hypothetical protein